MANRTVKSQGTNIETSGAGNEKDDNTSSTTGNLAGYSLHDNNPKIAGLAAGYREATKTK